MARALERDGRNGAGSACAARGDQPWGLVIAKAWIGSRDSGWSAGGRTS
jgi:hypothetical protein